MKRALFLLPALLLLLLSVFLWRGLSLNPHELPSALVGKPAPAFALPRLDNPQQLLEPQNFRGKPWLLNVWASWCGACVYEHPLLLQLADRKIITIVGLDYKDTPQLANAWLAQRGNPYRVVLSDTNGRIGIDYGVYGVPETFLIDAQGIIVAKHVGPLTEAFIEHKVLPLLRTQGK